MVRKFCHIEQIIGNPPHDLANLGIIKISIGQQLQMRIGITAHVSLNPRPHHMTHICHIKICQRIQNPQSKIHQSKPQHHARCQQRHIHKRRVRDLPYNQRQHDLAHRRQRRAAQIHAQRPAVRLKIRQKPSDQCPC